MGTALFARLYEVEYRAVSYEVIDRGDIILYMST